MKNIFLSLLLLGVFYNKAYSAFCSNGTIEEVTNAITNGDFNDAGDGWATGWSVSGGLNPSSSYNAHGQYVFLWDSSTISQTINIEKNTEYQVKFMGAYSVKKDGSSDPNDSTYKGQAARFTFSNGNSIKQEVRHWIFTDNSLKTYTVDLGNSGNSTELTIKACAGGCTGASGSFIKIDYFRLYKCVPSSGGGDDDTPPPPPPPPPTSITKKVKLTIYNDDASFLAKEGNSHILHTKIVNKSFAFSIHSVDENKNDKVNTVAKDVKVRLIPASQSCSSNAGEFTQWTEKLTLENKKEATAKFKSSAVNKNLKVQITWKNVRNEQKIECCSADNFAIRPDKFIIELEGKTLTNPLKAEEVVNMKVKAVDEHNATVTSYTDQNISETITDAKYSGDQKSHGLNVDGETVINGIVSKNTSYDEVGKLTITVEEKPPYFAEVDKDDSPDTYKITKATYQVRVVPEHFGISYTMQDQNPSNNITFIANNLTNMRSTLSYTVKAEGKNGKTLTRYTKDKYADDVDITINQSTTTEGSRNVTLNYKNSKTNSSKTFNTSAGTNLVLNFSQGDFTDGDFNDTVYENFSRDPKVAQNPIILSTNTISAKEKNGVGSYKATGSQTSSQQANFYYGRVHAPSPQTSDQPSMLAKVYYEIYYNGSDSNKSRYPKSQGQASIDSVYWYILPPSVVSGFNSGICDYNSVSVASSGATAFRHGIYDINVTAANLPHANKIYYTPNAPYLRYDKIGSLLPKHYFDVKFTTSNTTWAGEGKTGHTVDTNISTIDNRSLDW